MNVRALFGWGITIYALFFLLQSVFVTYGFVQGFAPALVSAAVLIAISLIAATTLRATSWKDVLPYSITWAVIAAILDGVLSFPYTGLAVYSTPSVLLGYAVIVVAPLFVTKFCIACSLFGMSCPIHARE